MRTAAPHDDIAGVVAPAPIFFVIASAIGAALEWLYPSTLLAQPYARFVGAVLIAISIALVAAVLVQMVNRSGKRGGYTVKVTSSFEAWLMAKSAKYFASASAGGM